MHRRGMYGGHGCGGLVGVGSMVRGVKVGVSAGVISAVVLSGLFLLAFAPGMWWLVTIYGWVVFPAIGNLGGGDHSALRRHRTLEDKKRFAIEPFIKDDKRAGVAGISGEQEILEALGKNGSLTVTRAALETSLSVAEAEEILVELADGGHLEVKVREGGLFYSMWGVGDLP